MFEIKNFHKNVFVEGNILFDTDMEVSYTDIVAFSTFDKNNYSSKYTFPRVFLYLISNMG